MAIKTADRQIFSSYAGDLLVETRRMQGDIERILLDEKAIEKRVDAMALEIGRDFPDGTVLVIVLLNGAMVFAADLLRRVELVLEVECVRASSYHGGMDSSGVVDFGGSVFPDVRGRHVLLLDDILDTGRTLHAVSSRLELGGAASLRRAVLLAKDKKRAVNVDVDYTGFMIGDEFVVGYGLDYRGRYRNLPYLGVLKQKVTGVEA